MTPDNPQKWTREDRVAVFTRLKELILQSTDTKRGARGRLLHTAQQVLPKARRRPTDFTNMYRITHAPNNQKIMQELGIHLNDSGNWEVQEKPGIPNHRDTPGNSLPKTIEAWEYAETCGATHIRDGIVMMDDLGNPICRMNSGTIREKKIALLWQASIALLNSSKKACAQTRATKTKMPDWLAELEAAIQAAEHGHIP